MRVEVSAVIVPLTERKLATRLATRFGVRPHGTVERHLDTLSGGNQQKVVVGRALRCNPKLLVLEDPTAGVDVGSRAELHRLIQAAAAEGTAVVLLSTDFDEITALSDRVLVMNSGRIRTELTGDRPHHRTTRPAQLCPHRHRRTRLQEGSDGIGHRSPAARPAARHRRAQNPVRRGGAIGAPDLTINGAMPEWFLKAGRIQLAGVPLPFVYVVIAAAVLWLALEFTTWGRQVYAAGGNAKAAQLAGVPVARVTVQAFAGTGVLCGVAGVLSVSILGASSPVVGLGALLPAFAGAFLGATSIRPGRYNALGTVIAVYVVAVGITGLRQHGALNYVEQYFYGLALLIAVSLARLTSSRA